MAVEILVSLLLMQGVVGSKLDQFGESQNLNLKQSDAFREMANRMEAMEIKLGKIDELESRIENMDAIIKSQRSQILAQGRKIGRLEAFLQLSAKEIPKEEQPMESDKAVKKQDSDRMAIKTNHTRSQKASVGGTGNKGGVFNSVQAMLQRRSLREADGNIAFSAILSQSTQHLGEHQPVIFDKVKLNDGQGYNQYSGHFTCPMSGVYMFIYHLGVQNVQAWLHLVVNGAIENTATAEAAAGGHGTAGAQELQGGNSIILRLTQGDNVWIEAYAAEHGNTLMSLLTSFSGFLLY